MKFRTTVFAVAGVLSWAAMAQAQPAPDAPPAPPPDPAAPAAPPAAPPADQPAPPPADQPPPPPADAPPPAPPPPVAPPENPPLPSDAPPPPPVLSFGGPTPQVDAVQPPDAWKKPNPWAYTWFTWTQSASAKILGVGRNYISTDDEVYSWDFTLTPRYAFVNTPTDQVYASASLGAVIELTNSDTTQLEHEWLFKDTQVGVGWAHVVYESKDHEWKNTPAVSLSVLLPTSQASADEGKYFQAGLGVSDRSIVKLRGTKSDWFPNALVIGGINYSHLFSRTYDPTAASPVRVRQDAYGENTSSDQLSMSSFNEDQLKLSFIYYLTIWKDLSFGNAWGISVPFKHQFTPTKCDTVVATNGCIAVGNAGANSPEGPATTGIPITNFDVSLSYDFFGLGRLDVGYNNEAPELGFNGQRANVFYSAQTAQFYVDVVAYLDGIYDKTAEKLRKNKQAAKDQQLKRLGVINY